MEREIGRDVVDDGNRPDVAEHAVEQLFGERCTAGIDGA
jgi:hypothetical protein